MTKWPIKHGKEFWPSDHYFGRNQPTSLINIIHTNLIVIVAALVKLLQLSEVGSSVAFDEYLHISF